MRLQRGNLQLAVINPKAIFGPAFGPDFSIQAVRSSSERGEANHGSVLVIGDLAEFLALVRTEDR
jgi:hypothetical protein